MKTLLLIAIPFLCLAQTYPTYGPEKTVNIIGWNDHSMEPFLSPDGQYLLFNNLNDGLNTRLFYASRINDSSFNFVGEMNGPNPPAALHLDAVPDLDTLDNFYWTSTRMYPYEFDNLFHGNFSNGTVTNIGRVRGDFYIYQPGWLIMDHGISNDGQLLYFNNARFDATCTGPCETRLGIAQKVNDSTFAVLPNSDTLLSSINDSNYIYYAPFISADNLELYYTRFLKGLLTLSTLSEVCVATRTSPLDPFSIPLVLFSDTLATKIVEAPCLSTDKQIMYYHKKVNGIHRIRMRYRLPALGIKDLLDNSAGLKIFPNPARENIRVQLEGISEGYIHLILYNSQGMKIKTWTDLEEKKLILNLKSIAPGYYILQAFLNGKMVSSTKLIIE